MSELPEEKRDNNPILNRNKERCVLRAANDWRVRWDLVIIALATYNCITVPIGIGFEPPFMSELWFAFLNQITTLFFFLDIILTFRTSYMKKGEEETKPSKIAIHYLKGNFVADVLSTFPFDFFGISRR